MHAAVSHGVDGAPTARSRRARPRGKAALRLLPEVGDGHDRRARVGRDTMERVSQRYVASCGLLDLDLTAEILSVVLNCPKDGEIRTVGSRS